MGKGKTAGPLRKLFELYLNSSVHVSLSVVSLCLVTAVHFELSFDWNFLLFIFFGSVTGYNFVKFAGIAKLHHRSLARNLRIIQIFSLLSFFGLVYFAYQIPFKVLLWSAFFGLFTLIYAVPVFSNKRNLRAVAGMKVLVIAVVWAGVTGILPLVNENVPVTFSAGIEFLQRFLFVLVLMLPFEIRDLKYDKEDLKTIPQRMGIGGAKKLGYLMLVGWTLCEPFKETASMASVLSIGFTAVVTGIVLYKTKEIQPSYYASFWVEGVPLVWLWVLLLLERII